MEKYYDLIVSMVKQHKKYPGCEEILDDIVSDVCEHAKVVADAIENEDVLKSYLEKIVTTSMITVPKKLGLSFRKNHRSAFEEIQSLSTPAVEKVQEQIFVQGNADTESNDIISEGDNVLNLKEDLSDVEASSLDTESEKLTMEEENNETEEASLDIKDQLYEEIESDSNDGDIISSESEAVADAEIVESADSIIQVDKTLVDKMINGVDKGSDEQIFAEEETVIVDPSEDELSLIPDEEESLNEVVLPEELAEDGLSGEEILSEEPIEELLNEEIIPEEPVEANLTSEEVLPEEPLEEAVENPMVEDLGETIDGLFDNVEDLEENSELVELEDLQIDAGEDFPADISDSSDELVDTLENTEDLSDIDVSEKVLNEETAQEVKSGSVYEIFDFENTTDDYDIDCEQLLKDLTSLNAKYPDKHIKQICNLKYNENMSISDIAKKLNISEDDVLESLSEIVYLVKD